jgi:molybdenum cofactor biosynthesis protein B
MDHSKRIDQSAAFVPVNIAVLTVSDSRKAGDDRSGDLLATRVEGDGHNLAARTIVTDDFDAITAQIRLWVADPAVDVVVATGGTGLTGRDGTPEAFRAVFEKEIEGFGELFRYISFAKIGTSTIQSRAVAGVAGGTYLFALPGSPSACRDGWDEILRYQLDIRHRPCNFVEILPRLSESPTQRRGG